MYSVFSFSACLLKNSPRLHVRDCLLRSVKVHFLLYEVDAHGRGWTWRISAPSLLCFTAAPWFTSCLMFSSSSNRCFAFDVFFFFFVCVFLFFLNNSYFPTKLAGITQLLSVFPPPMNWFWFFWFLVQSFKDIKLSSSILGSEEADVWVW